MAYVGLQQLAGSYHARVAQMHRYFAIAAVSLALHDFLWLVRSYQTDAFTSHNINMVQWFLTWVLAGSLLAFVELYLIGRQTWRSKLALGMSALQILLLLILPKGGYYLAMPVVISSNLPWGEHIFTPDYQSHFTVWYWLVCAWVMFIFFFMLGLALRHEQGEHSYRHGRIMTLSLTIIFLCIFHDLALDFHLWPDIIPIRLQHIGIVLMALSMNFTMGNEVNRSAALREQLEESEGRLRLLTQNVPGVLYRMRISFSGEMEILSISGSLTRLFGPEASLQNVLSLYLAGLSKEDAARCLASSRQTTQARQPFEFESPFNPPEGGKTRWYRFIAQPTVEQDGLVYSGLILDETKQWESNQERDRLHAELQNKTEEQKSVLHATSHDLRSPLLNIRGFIGEIGRDLSELSEELEKQSLVPDIRAPLDRLHQSLRFVESSAERMTHLLDGLLAVVRTGRIQINVQEVNVDALLQLVLEGFEHRLRMEQVQILKDSLPKCMADPDLLSQIFANLIDNAIKYRSPSRNLEIHISGEVHGGEIWYHVKDNGIGFDQKMAPQVFRLFHRLHPRSNIEGHGIGLTIAQSMANRMRGFLEVQSEEGFGSVFTVRMLRTS